ncbi:1584_t:CDS:2 [Entrophospora sp. SA101]|nr:1584_t:CDS:2 [Entrophospora sp. SA101]
MLMAQWINELMMVSSKTISKARLHSKVNGPGCAGVEKPIITRVRITEEAKRQFEIFFADKNIVNLSSYRVNEKTGDPVKYLKDQKETLWRKYFELHPSGMKRTSFLKHLNDGVGLKSTIWSNLTKYAGEIFWNMNKKNHSNNKVAELIGQMANFKCSEEDENMEEIAPKENTITTLHGKETSEDVYQSFMKSVLEEGLATESSLELSFDLKPEDIKIKDLSKKSRWDVVCLSTKSGKSRWDLVTKVHDPLEAAIREYESCLPAIIRKNIMYW